MPIHNPEQIKENVHAGDQYDRYAAPYSVLRSRGRSGVAELGNRDWPNL